MSSRLQGRAAVLIGAAAGIGRGIAARLVEDGADLVLGDRDAERGLAAVRALGLPDDRFLKVDVALEEEVEALAALALRRLGRIDILVQNAGIYPFSLIGDTSVAQWDRVQAVNLRSAFLSARACAPAMRAQGRGRMVFTSSITGPRVVSHGLAAYAATKAGINGFIKVAALEFAAFGITVNAVEPGNILTEGLQSDRSPEFIESMERSIPIGRLGTPRDIANAVAFLASDDAAYITGTTIVVDGGQTLPESKDFLDPATWH
jgi:3-oxoacyl-[acyl-carrier protein] reductase